MLKTPNSTKTNILFNLGGRVWIALIGILFVPIYLRYLSVEVYGIIGFFASLQAVLVLLDGGISPALNREIARLSAFPERSQEMRDLSWTLEVLCWAIALAVGAIGLAISPLVAYYWLSSENLSPETILQSLMLMSVSFTFQWAMNFYTSGFLGLQRQKLYNVVNCVGVTIRSVGAFLILAFVSPTIQAFLLWQVFAVFLSAVMMAIAYWSCLPATGSRAKFDTALLRGIWRYAAGMTGINFVSLILTQSDKIILSRLLTLEYLGYYTLATTLVSSALGIITGAVGNAYFPQFSRLVALDDDQALRRLYHQGCQVMSVFLIPLSLLMSFFSFEILMLWTGNEKIARNSYILLSLIAIGTGMHGLMHLPYFMQLANGLTKLAVWQNIIAIILLIPFMIYATIHYGAMGGAMTWVILNSLYTLVGMQVMHRMLLRGELKKWYFQDVGLPLLIALLVTSASALLFPREVPAVIALFWLAATLSAAVLPAILSLGDLRATVLKLAGSAGLLKNR